MITAFITRLPANKDVMLCIVCFNTGVCVYHETHDTAQDAFDYVATNYPGTLIYCKIEYNT